jgi:hypothetical protein
MRRMQDFERLGAFYLGRTGAGAAPGPGDGPLLYASADLVTHGVCIGMTGSGKTGLCLALIEEAALDGIPVLAIDPKGDLPNLLLAFPALRGGDFAPWIDPDAARRAGLDPAAHAELEAARWRDGLAQWGQDGARIQRLRDAAAVTVYTPGSTAGEPLAVLASFAAPGPAVVADPELLAERVSASVAALLGLLGLDADPLASREHLLLAQILGAAWAAGRDLDLAALVAQVQRPPVARLGLIELDTAYPPAERFELAMKLNTLLASPTMALWARGTALDLDLLLHGSDGKPRVAIVSIAHLGERERMFVVAAVMNQVLAWTRRQGGTSSLRALIYVDEVAGYLPPVANPPSKPAMLTLLKQGRAFGVGLLLATQNPVDLDYKALANAGTWFVGKLQTERDRERVLAALEGASANGGRPFDRAATGRLLASLGARRFLLHDVHEDGPVVFTSRWALSYLRGPMTRDQLRSARELAAGAPAVPPTPPATADPGAGPRPILPPAIAQRFVPVRTLAPGGSRLRYRPALLGRASVRYHDAKLAVDTTATVVRRAAVDPASPWAEAEPARWPLDELAEAPEDGASFAPLPSGVTAAWWAGVRGAFADAIQRREQLSLLRSPALGAASTPDEDERAFRVRLGQVARERRDAACDLLRRKHAPRIAALRERLRRAEIARERESAQVARADLGTAVSLGATILGALFGRKAFGVGGIGRAAGSARAGGRSLEERADVARAEREIAHWRQELADLERDGAADLEALRASLDALTLPLETTVLRPRRGDVAVDLVALVWEPVWVDPTGEERPAWH